MKKHENSDVSIRQIMFTTLFVAIVSFGGLNAYRIVHVDSTETIPAIESANINENTFETALVENTEDDFVYSEHLKFLALNEKVDESTASIDEATEETTETKVDTRYQDKIVSRGNYVREMVADEILSNISKDSSDVLLQTIVDESKELESIKNEILGQSEENKTVNEVSSQNASNSTQSTKQDEEKNETVPQENITKENSKQEALPTANNNKTQVVASTENNSHAEAVTNTESNNQAQATTVAESNANQQVPPTNYVKTIDVKATAYCLCQKCCGKSPSSSGYGVTASGLKIVPGTGMKVVASDPSVIPLGTKVYIEGLNGAKDYGYAVVADTGGAIKNLKIDLYMDTHQMALNWGVKNVRVYVLAD